MRTRAPEQRWQGMRWRQPGDRRRLDHDNIRRSQLRFDARRWYALKLAPKWYGDKIVQEVQGSDGGPVQTSVVDGMQERLEEIRAKMRARQRAQAPTQEAQPPPSMPPGIGFAAPVGAVEPRSPEPWRPGTWRPLEAPQRPRACGVAPVACRFVERVNARPCNLTGVFAFR